MKNKKYILALIPVLAVLVSLFFFQKEKDPRAGYDKPDGYYNYFKAITTPFGQAHSNYKPNYALKEFNKTQQNNGVSLKSAGDYTWVQRGPGNVGGRTRTILIDPDDNTGKTWFVGSVSGGIWKTTDGGDTWANLTPDLPNLSTATLAMSEANTSVIYAGTGEGFGGEGMVSGNGIFKSLDKGISWQAIQSINNDEHFRYVNKLWASPSNEEVLIAATNKGIFKTEDGGATWDSVFTRGYAVQDIVQNPQNEDVLYAGVNSLGVFKSTNQGETWHPSSSGMTELYRVSISVSPVDTAYLFAGVEAPGDQTHIYQSRDAGASWTLNYNADGLYTNFHKQQGWFNNVIAAHPFERNKVFVGGVYMGLLEFGAGTQTSARDVVRVDTFGTAKFMHFVNFGGNHFSGTLATGIDEGAEVDAEDFVSVEIRFDTNLSQKAHRFTVPEGEGAGVPPEMYTYEDYIDVPFQVWDVENNRQLMVSFRDQDRNGIFNLTERVYGDDVSGREYIFIHAQDYSATVPHTDIAKDGGYEEKLLYFMWPTMPVDKVWDEGLITKAIVDIQYGSIEFRDAYTTVLSNDRLNDNLHVDHHDLKFFIPDAAKDSFVIVDANDGGLGFSADFGKSWKQINKGYLTTQFYGVAKRAGKHEYIGGMQDNGTWQSPLDAEASATSEYEFRLEGDGFEALWHPVYEQRIIASSYSNYIKVSNDYGETWQWIEDKVLGDGPFITKLSHSRENPDLIFAVGSRGVYRHTNFGLGTSSWELVNLGDNWAINNVVTSSHHVEVSKAKPSIVWAGGGMYRNPDLNLYVSKDYGKNFDTVSNYNADEMGYISGLATHPTNQAEAFALFSFQGKAKILRTYDYGSNWEDITGFTGHDGDSSLNGFPDVVVNDLLVLPHDTNTIWAGTEIGLFESSDNGVSWHYANSGLPAVSIWQMDIVDGHVIMATHGRGVWTADLGIVNIQPVQQQEAQLQVYPNPASDNITISFSAEENPVLKIFSMEGKLVLLEVLQAGSGNDEFTVDISGLHVGNYIVQVQAGSKVAVSKLLVK